MRESLGETIVIVSGLPRSGTSMMMRMLDQGGIPILADGNRRADIDNPNGYYEYDPVLKLKRDSSWVHLACGKAVKIIYALLPSLPGEFQYKVIFMERDIKEVLASQDAMLTRNAKPTSELGKEKLAGIFKGELETFFEWAESRPDLEIMRVGYRQVLEYPQTAAEDIREFLDVEMDLEAMVAVCNPALHRQRC